MIYELTVRFSPVKPFTESQEDAVRLHCRGSARRLINALHRALEPRGGVEDTKITISKRESSTDEDIGRLLDTLIVKNANEECLDEAVHNAASAAASTVNNQGMEGQLRYLLEELGLDETRKIVEQVPQGAADGE